MSESRGSVLFVRTDPANFDPRILKETTSLQGAGYHVGVLGWDRAGEHAREEVIGGIPYRRCRIRAPYGSKKLIFFLPLFWMWSIVGIIRRRPDVLHACDLDALIPALIARFFTGSRVVYDIFDHFGDKISNVPDSVRSIIRGIDRWAAGMSDLVLVADEHRVALLSGLRSVPVGIIMNVPPLVTNRSPRRGTGPPVKLCYAGVIHEGRGLHLVAEAIEGVDGIETVFAGWIPRPVDRDFLLAQTKISYIGKVPYAEAMKLIGESDILLALYDPSVPINRLASSNKVFEAMSVGIPVISNRETTMVDVINGVSCGLTIPYGESSLLREAIIRLKDDPELRAGMGDRGYRAYRERYNWDIMERRLLEYYGNLRVERRSAGG